MCLGILGYAIYYVFLKAGDVGAVVDQLVTDDESAEQLMAAFGMTSMTKDGLKVRKGSYDG